MINRTVLMGRGVLAAAALAMCVVVAASGLAQALDVNEVKQLMKSQVPEDVIINMIKSDGTIYITPEEANEFRALGASENLVTALRPRPTSVDGPVYATPPPAAVTSQVLPPVVTDQTPMQSATVVAQGPAMPAAGSPITPVSITSSSAYPPLYSKEGWVSIANHDWIAYYVNFDLNKHRIFLSKTPNGGTTIAPGQSLTFNVRKESYKMYGDSGNDLKVKVREGEATSVALNPFGVFGNSGMTGVSVDRDNVRSEVLFSNYVPAPTIIVQEAPTVVVPAPPPPVYYRYYPYQRYRGDGIYFRYYGR